jgi:hypothetical protein
MSTIECANCKNISLIDREGYCEICYLELDKIEESHSNALTNSSLNDAEFLQHLQELNTIIPASSPLPSEEIVEEAKADEVARKAKVSLCSMNATKINDN